MRCCSVDLTSAFMQVDPVTRVLSIALMAIKGADQMDVEPIVQTISFVLVGNVAICLVSSDAIFKWAMDSSNRPCMPTTALITAHLGPLPQEFS